MAEPVSDDTLTSSEKEGSFSSAKEDEEDDTQTEEFEGSRNGGTEDEDSSGGESKPECSKQIMLVGRTRRPTTRGNGRVHVLEKDSMLEKTVVDIMQNRVSITQAIRRHKIGSMTLKRRLIVAGHQLPSRNNKRGARKHIEMAVQAVLNRGLTAAQAAKEFKTSHSTVSIQLTLRGYDYRGRRWVKRVDAPSNATEASSSQQFVATEDRDAHAESETEWCDMDGDKGDLPGSKPQEKVTAEEPDGAPARGQSSEIEWIVDVRRQRQYLVRWQGETAEQATWVDEEVFLGLTLLKIQ